MIIKLSNADASQNNLGRIVLPENFQEETISAVAAFNKYSINSSQVLALDSYISGLKTAGIWSKIKYFFLPTFAGNISSALYNIKANGKTASFVIPEQWSIDENGFNLQKQEDGHENNYYWGSAQITFSDPLTLYPFSAIAYYDKYIIPDSYVQVYNFILVESTEHGASFFARAHNPNLTSLGGIFGNNYNFNPTHGATASVGSDGMDNISVINIKTSQGTGNGNFLTDGSNIRGVNFNAPSLGTDYYPKDVTFRVFSLFDLDTWFGKKDFKFTAKKYIVIFMEDALTTEQETSAHTLTSSFISSI